jgi:hypothetical protein
MTRYTPLWLQQGNYPASVDRALIGGLYPNGGYTGMAVTPATAMTLNIAAGRAAVPTANGTGSVLCWSDAVEQVTLTAAPPGGQNRYDLVTVQPRGNDLDGGANNDWIFNVVTGTAAASPTVPSVPAGQLAVVQVYVPGGSASINTSAITRRGRALQPGVTPMRFRAWRTADQTLAIDGLNAALTWDQLDDVWSFLPGGPNTSQIVCPVDGLLQLAWSVLMVTGGTAPTNPNLTTMLTSPVNVEIRRGSSFTWSGVGNILGMSSVGSAIIPVTAGFAMQIQPYASAAGATKKCQGGAGGSYCYIEGAYLSTT